MIKRKKKKINFFKLLLFVSVCYFLFTMYFPKSKDFAISFNFPLLKDKKEAMEKQMAYDICMSSSFRNEELNEELINKKEEITSFIINNHYNTSVYYEDLTTGFYYTYKENKIYYGCSLIKLVDALYLIEKAINEEIDLDQETVLYEAKYKMSYSAGLATRRIGESISLRDLITYAISVSDNSAHLMLIDYIGFNNLKEYGKSLGAKVILTGGDNFGNQTTNDTNIYLKKAYKIIMGNKEYGEFLKSIMDNNDRNDFNTDKIKIYHKYGSYDNNYHDIGLSLDERPYAISIFTLHEYTNHQEVIQTIHEKVRELHELFLEYRKNKCDEEVYVK